MFALINIFLMNLRVVNDFEMMLAYVRSNEKVTFHVHLSTFHFPLLETVSNENHFAFYLYES